MIMTRSKPEMTEDVVKCPFCQKGDIDIVKTLDWYSEGKAHAAGKSAMITQYHPEKFEVRNKCQKCGKSKKEIKEVLQSGQYKYISHEERLKRIKESGLPTILKYSIELRTL